MNEEITLYPSNWLYNAGVVGFLRVLERVLEECGEDVENFLKDDGSVEVDVKKINVDRIFSEWDNLTKMTIKISYEGKKGGTKNYYYSNQTEGSIRRRIELLFSHPNTTKRGKEIEKVCFTCGYKEPIIKKGDVEHLSQSYSNILLSSQKTFPNSYWNLNSENYICSRCRFILMCHHLGLIQVFSDKNEIHQIFINAPSFKLMWRLNNYAQKLYGQNEKGKGKNKKLIKNNYAQKLYGHAHSIKEILGISLIELARKQYIQLGKWEKMNIEVVVKHRVKRNDEWEDVIDFFSLPYEIVDLISNREIASLLNEIGEFKVLNYVLDGKFNMILEFGERIMRIALKPENERRKNEEDFIEEDFINENVKLKKNKDNLMTFSQNLFKLYALINDKTKKEVLI